MTQSVSDEPGSDEQARLVRQFCRGDRAAFAALVRTWEHRLLTIAYRVVGNVHDAEEVRQIVLLKLVQSPGQLRDPANFPGWLRRCVVNEAITWLRRRGADAVAKERLDERVASMLPSPAEQADADEQSRRLQEAVQELDPELRALVSLRFDECLTIRQIAEVVERPTMTVHSQITRALDQLRRRLASDLGNP